MRTKGFTLVEMMVVVVIIGIVVGFTMPAMETWLTNTKIRSAAENVQNGLRKAQQLAAARNSDVSVVFTERAYNGAYNSNTGTCPPTGDRKKPSEANYLVICADANSARSRDPKKPDGFSDDIFPMSVQYRTPPEDGENVVDIISDSFFANSNTDKVITFRATGGTNSFAEEGKYLKEPKLQFASKKRDANQKTTHNCSGKAATNPDKGNNEGDIRCLMVLMKLGGKVRMCDPGYDDTDGSSTMRSMACQTKG